ncbi:MAG: ABC transporter substrate-binding protein [Dorea sp.]
MKFQKFKRLTAALLVGVMVLSMAACGQKEESTAEETETEETTESGDVERPEAVSEEDWEAMKKEPVFGTEINYLFNGGACVSAKYMAEVQGYYEEYGINATYLEGDSVVNTVGTGQCMWGTDHIATMLVPVTNGVNMTFVCGSHIGCKSIYVPKDSDIQTVDDLVGKTIAIHDGIGNSDQNICYRLLDEYGVDPTTEVEFLDINDNAATVAAMESGEVDATIFSDYFVLANYRDDMRMICSITYSEEFQDEPCCVTAMNNDFIEQNPVHAKYVVMAIKRAGEFNRLHSEEAVQAMFDNDKMTGEMEDQLVFWDSLHFGLSDAFTERALREIAEDYLRLGIITDTDLTVDEIMDMAWTPVCPDEEIEGLTVGDPVEPENAVVPVQQKENPAVAEGFGLSK